MFVADPPRRLPRIRRFRLLNHPEDHLIIHTSIIAGKAGALLECRGLDDLHENLEPSGSIRESFPHHSLHLRLRLRKRIGIERIVICERLGQRISISIPTIRKPRIGSSE